MALGKRSSERALQKVLGKGKNVNEPNPLEVLLPDLAELATLEDLRINEDGLQSIQFEHRLERSLDDFFNTRQWGADGIESRGDINGLWTSAGLRKPAGRSFATYSRRTYKYPILAVYGKFPLATATKALVFGFEAGNSTSVFLTALFERYEQFRFYVAGAKVWEYGLVTNFMPADYDTVNHTYTIVMTEPMTELYIDKVLVAVGLHTLKEAIPTWQNNSPYTLFSTPSAAPKELTTFIEMALPIADEIILPVSSINGFMATDGIPLPSRQYALYTENTATKWAGLATGGDLKTSHPVPVWGYEKKTLVFQADAAGNLDIQVYAGGGWRSWVPGGITLVVNQLEVYNLNGEIAIARCVYTPTNADTIILAEWYLS